MKLSKWWYFTKKIREKRTQIWDREFTKRFLSESREGLRIEYDRLNEELHAAQRRLVAELYKVIESEYGTEMDIRTIAITAEEIEKLPTEKTKDTRYYKVVKQDPDKTIVETLTKQIERMKPDVAQLQEQMQALTQRIEGPLKDDQGIDHSLNASMDDLRTVIKLLQDHRKNLWESWLQAIAAL